MPQRGRGRGSAVGPPWQALRGAPRSSRLGTSGAWALCCLPSSPSPETPPHGPSSLRRLPLGGRRVWTARPTGDSSEGPLRLPVSRQDLPLVRPVLPPSLRVPWVPVPQAAFQKAQPRRPLAPRPLPCPTGAISRRVPSGGRVARTPEEAAELGQPRACGGHSVRVRCVCTVAQSLGAVSSAWLTAQNRPLSQGARAWGSRAVRGGSGSACRGMCNSLYPLDASNNPSCDNQNDSRHCCMSPARQNCSQARASALTHQTSPATAGGNPSLDCGPRPCPSCLQGSGGPSQSQGTRGSEAGWGRPHRDTSPGPSRWSCNRPGQQLPPPSPSGLTKHKPGPPGGEEA